MNNNKLYKNLSFILGILLILVTSCAKDDNPKYVPSAEVIDTTSWEDSYVYAGTLPTVDTTTKHNELYGTKWVLTKYVAGFATQTPNDTIHFINNTHYRLNSQTTTYQYYITSSAGTINKSLTLSYFSPFGGSVYTGQVGPNFVSDGVINNALFNDNYLNKEIKAWFKKI